MSNPQSNPKITFITVVRNGAKTIERCLQSVAAQTYKNIEYIVLDAASTDGTQAIIERYRPAISYYHSQPDKGAYDATMQGYRMATGDVVGVIHADDWLAPHAAETLANMAKSQPGAQIFCFAMQEHLLKADGSLKESRRFCDPPGDLFHLADGLYCQGCNRYYARELIKREGHFRNDIYPQLGDREFYVRIGLQAIPKAWSDEVLYHFLVHPGSNSTGGTPQKTADFLDETARIAADTLLNPAISPRERGLLIDWYCFNAIRSVWFKLRGGNITGAYWQALRLFLRYPLPVARNLLSWRMPEAYRSKAPL